MAGAIVLASTGTEPLSIAMLLGATAMVLVGCLAPHQAFRSIDGQMYLFIAGAIPLGTAMNKTGLANVLGSTLGALVGQWSELGILFAVFVLVAVVVQFMGSDSATTALFGPMAIALGVALGQAPEAYIVTVAIASITATFTPMAHHNLVIYRPGGYRFTDYARVGAPLTVLIGGITATLAPRLWPA
jgi:di/tricarboxylate transporter